MTTPISKSFSDSATQRLNSDPSTQDPDPQETREWLEALQALIEREGVARAHQLIEQLVDAARRAGADLPYKATTAYVNTISVQCQARSPGDAELENRLRAVMRWNAMAMVVKANRENSEYGGHIASFASIATLYEVAFNHFFHAADEHHGGDLVFFQGHAAPGIYARAFLEGRLTEAQLLNFRRESGGQGQGLSSYPHPWLMPDFWQFPTVSMGLGPIQAIYQARFMRYLENRSLIDATGRKIWCFCGDGEMDEPESLGAIGMAAREQLDNLIFVINCNLQRLDGPVRGDGKIIQELESHFRGSGWNVIKVIWGSDWDTLLARDSTGLLQKRMDEVVDGEYQTFKSKDGAYVRKHFFGKYPELLELVANMSDDDIWRLKRGGHDPHKVYAAYAAAMADNGRPTVVLAKTVKGYGMGKAGEALNISHQQKKMDLEAIKTFRDRFGIPIDDAQLADLPFYKPPADSAEMRYLHERRQALGGFFPSRRTGVPPLPVPALATFDALLKSSEGRELSTTMAFVRLLSVLLKDEGLGSRIVPIVPDEARTFGMEGLFRQFGIYAPTGQLFEPEDAGSINYYREDRKGQMLEEGICEAGAISSWIAAGTAYTNHALSMVPFFINYSMFGFQRVGDLIWLAGDIQARGFLMGATAGRTTLAGEGLQHQDGHSQVMAANVPNCVAYDPAFAYELAVIIQDGLQRMYVRGDSVFYYITIANENYAHPALPAGSEAGIIKGMYCLNDAGPKAQVQLLGSGSILREVIAAAELLKADFGVSAGVWSVTSFTELSRDGADAERWNRLHPEQKPRSSYVQQCLAAGAGPVVAATDYVRLHMEQIRPYVPRRYVTLGTDGFGRSDCRQALRRFFEVDRQHVVVAALKALADEGALPAAKVSEAIARYGLDPDKANPMTV
ncbi:MAG: pyruvate dehydrogenase (acetyl-transferring), homodimeric type [Methylococcaceae bacterium]|nr:MAG: pyruvate dehydrogenase (acetyl-transferring), homodimeric type [Methylococcaceae bacterium]